MLKPIPSNPAYLISDSGQVFSTKSNKYLKTPCGNVGYPLVNLTAGKGKRTTHTVHSLVAEAFIGSRTPSHENSKACVAINKGKVIKGFHLVYA